MDLNFNTTYNDIKYYKQYLAAALDALVPDIKAGVLELNTIAQACHFKLWKNKILIGQTKKNISDRF